jgi:putative FmdB family regulatory protein
MPTYSYRCPACALAFEGKRPVEERHLAACPGCGADAWRQFDPAQVMIQTPESLHYIRADFEPLSTAAHSSNYLAGQVVAEHCDGMHAKQQESRKNYQSFPEFFAKRHPGVDLNQRLTKQETAEVKTALGVTNG